MEDVKAYIAKQIKVMREERRWRQDELGAKLDPPKGGGTISSWETGRTTPDAETLINLCRVFEVDIKAFYPKHSSNNGALIAESKDQAELVEIYSRLSETGQTALVAAARGLLSAFPKE